VRIAYLVLHGLARLSRDLKQRSVIPFKKYQERRALFQLSCPLLIAVGKSLRYLWVKLQNALIERGLDIGELFGRRHLDVLDLQHPSRDGRIGHVLLQGGLRGSGRR
jgi:hypothetical protein